MGFSDDGAVGAAAAARRQADGEDQARGGDGLAG